MGVQVVNDVVPESLQLSLEVVAVVLASLAQPLLELMDCVLAVSAERPVCPFIASRR